MKRKFFQLAFWLGLGALSAGNMQAQGPVSGCPGAFGPVKHIHGTNKSGIGPRIKKNTHWVKDTIYILHHYVRVDGGATLTIDPGTIVMGFPAPSDTSTLIIQSGSKIIANGTPTLPIVFTSCNFQGTRNRGDWGGLIICGLALNNQVQPPAYTQVELEGNYGAFHGGRHAADNSGSLSYIRIEFSGVAFAPNAEINGLTLASVGSGTIINHIQVSHSNDDSFEWFGGNVNSTHLISWKGLDDDFDTDNGYSGKSQFGVGYRDPEIADFSGAKGFESDNDALGSGALPQTKAIFANYEVYGPGLSKRVRFNQFLKNGAHLRRNTAQNLYNTVFLGWPSNGAPNKLQCSGVYIDGHATNLNAIRDSLRIRNSVASAYMEPINIPALTSDSAAWKKSPYWNIIKWFKLPAYHNVQSNSVYRQRKKAIFQMSPNFTLRPESPLATGSSWNTGTTPALDAFFLPVPYRGAFSDTDWTADWTEFNPILFVYTAGQPTRKAKFEALNDALPDNLTVSPNPASGSATLNFYFHNDAAGKIAVYDMNGAEAMTQEALFTGGNNTVPLNISAMQSGLYIVKIMTVNGDVKVAKFEVK